MLHISGTVLHMCILTRLFVANSCKFNEHILVSYEDIECLHILELSQEPTIH